MNRNIYRSKSVQLALKLISDIRLGVYQPGEKMPSVRQLAESCQVGRQVALSAITY